MKRTDKQQDQLREQTDIEFTWCLHCECAYKTESWVKNDWDCPDMECSGGYFDAHSWDLDDWPRVVHPEYPEIPEEGKYYPLY
jgi:hypothetical protein